VTVTASLTSPIVDLTGHVERSRLISAIPWVRHGITRRVPGLGIADGNVGYTAPRDEADAWEMRQCWARAMGIDPSDLVRVRQVHGTDVRVATVQDTERGTHPDAGEAPIGDAMITAEANVALMTLHADCLAMLLVDPVRRVVGAIHAGWRSTVRDIAGETVRVMMETFASDPSEIVAYVGPSIGSERYEVGDEVIEAWRSLPAASETPVCRISGTWRFDLKAANASQLRASGLRNRNIEISDICTATGTDRWFSHRAQGPLTGRFAAVISIAEAKS
jgi:YfiH family protein